MIKPVLLAASALLLVAPALAQAPDPHAGHVMPGAATTPAPPMDHSTMNHGGMAMAPAPKGITRSNIGPAEAALQAFSDALEVGNRDLAIARLAPGLKVVEDGIEESRAAYVGGHLAADIAYQKSVKAVLLERSVVNDSPTQARIVSKRRMVGNRSDKAIDTLVDETAVLVKLPDGWKILRLEWVSAE
jgi:hypothetical protein